MRSVRFTLRDLFWCLTLLGFGIAGLSLWIRGDTIGDGTEASYWTSYTYFVLALASGGAIGAGLLAPFQRKRVGGIAGSVLVAVAYLLVALAIQGFVRAMNGI